MQRLLVEHQDALTAMQATLDAVTKRLAATQSAQGQFNKQLADYAAQLSAVQSSQGRLTTQQTEFTGYLDGLRALTPPPTVQSAND